MKHRLQAILDKYSPEHMPNKNSGYAFFVNYYQYMSDDLIAGITEYKGYPVIPLKIIPKGVVKFEQMNSKNL